MYLSLVAPKTINPSILTKSLQQSRKCLQCWYIKSVLNLHVPSISSLAFPLLSLANSRIISNLKREISSHLPQQSNSFLMLLSKGLQMRLGLRWGLGGSRLILWDGFLLMNICTLNTFYFYRRLLRYHIVMVLWSPIEMSDKTTTLTQRRGLLIQVIRLQLAGIRQSDHKPSE